MEMEEMLGSDFGDVEQAIGLLFRLTTRKRLHASVHTRYWNCPPCTMQSMKRLGKRGGECVRYRIAWPQRKKGTNHP
jgi:hypothetical protein